MSEIILHHYDASPYAEKIRLALGLKGLAWRSVQIPVVMPKPDLVALTGGYRLTPVLQLGADVYCDTRAIVDALETLAPEPALVPAGRDAQVRGLAGWAEGVFMDVVLLFLAGGGFPEDLLKDRQHMLQGRFDADAARVLVPAKRDQVRARADVLERQLARAGPFLFGASPCLADLAAYHPLWMLSAGPGLARLLEPFPALGAWMQRVAAIGHGRRSEMDASEAIAIARASTSTCAVREDPADPNGRKPGDRVRVQPEAYGNCPVEGEWVAADARGLAIRRRDERAGEVVVHFPREGFLTFPLP